MDFSKMSKEQLLQLYQSETASRQGGQPQATPTQPSVQDLLKQAQPNAGQSIANAMSVLGGGKPVYDAGGDYSKLFAQEAIKKQFESPLDDQLKQERIKALQAGLTTDESGNIIKRPAAPKPMSSYGVADDDTRPPDEIYQGMNPENKALLDKVASYDVNPMSIPGMNNQARTELLKLTSALHPEYNQSEFGARSSFLKDFKSGKRSVNRLAANTLIKHMGSLEDTLGSVPSNPIQGIESMQRWGTKHFAGSSPEAIGMTNEASALNAVAGELSNVFKQTGSTDPEISSWKDSYPLNGTREAKQAYIKKGVELLQGRLGAGGNEYQSIMGKPYEQSLLSPDSQSVIDRINGGGQQEQPQAQSGQRILRNKRTGEIKVVNA